MFDSPRYKELEKKKIEYRASINKELKEIRAHRELANKWQKEIEKIDIEIFEMTQKKLY